MILLAGAGADTAMAAGADTGPAWADAVTEVETGVDGRGLSRLVDAPSSGAELAVEADDLGESLR